MHGDIDKENLLSSCFQSEEASKSNIIENQHSALDTPSLSILLVEDNDDIRELLGLSLEDAGINSTPFTNAEDALDYALNESSPKVILTDITLPGMDGTQLAAKIWSQYPDTCFIFMTGSIFLDELDLPIEKFDQYVVLQKPLEFKSIVKSIAKFTERPIND